ncbi:MAG: two-component sensor histidine kinase, partial [Gemmatimonadota bacterium]|nr:two-component sensor histidine kinase [Gemmatimonadota bacterium]
MALAAFLAVSTVALVPLLLVTGVSYRQYRSAFESDLSNPMLRFAAAAQQSLGSFLSERLSALGMIMRDTPIEDLKNSAALERVLQTMEQSFGGIVDLGVIDETGIQVAYAGPFALEGRDYAEHKFFQQARVAGVSVSDVFMGYRNLPHLVLAIHKDLGGHHELVLRATVDTDVFHFLVRARTSRRPEQAAFCRRCHSLVVPPFADAFIINQDGVLQTPSRFYGDILGRSRLPPLPHSSEPALTEVVDARGQPLVVAYTQIQGSPFTLVVLSPRDATHAGLMSVRHDVIIFVVVSCLLIVTVVAAGTTYVVRRVHDADLKRAALYHKMEYTNKLAAIGRLGAGVAHEINNPLSIITQKGGLLKDLLTMSDELPPKTKMIDLTDSVLKSAERCGVITHRLLGFARHMDVQQESIDLDALLHEVFGFLEKEASYRNLRITFDCIGEVPHIVSDRGQLQQVFLNIINNAFAAVDDGGHIEIGIRQEETTDVAVS